MHRQQQASTFLDTGDLRQDEGSEEVDDVMTTEMSTPGTALSVYATSTQLWIAPNAAVHGTAVSVAGTRAADLPGFLPRGAPV